MPEKILIKTPIGYGLSDSIDNFKDEYRQNPLNTFFVLPTERLCIKVKENLLDNHLSIIESSVTTPDMLASAIAGKNKEFKLISEEEAKLLLLKVLKRKKEYIEALSPSGEYSSRFLNDIYTLIKVISEQEADIEKIFSLTDKKKNRALIKIIKEYQDILKSKKLISPENIYKSACDFISPTYGKSSGDSSELSSNQLSDSSYDFSSVNTHDDSSKLSSNQLSGSSSEFSSDFKTIIFSGIFEPLPAQKRFIQTVSSAALKSVYFMPYSSNKKVCTDDGRWFFADKTEEIENEKKSDLFPYENIFGEEEIKSKPVEVYSKRYKNLKAEIAGIAGLIVNLLNNNAKPSKIAVVFPDPAGATTVVNEVFFDFGLSYSSSAKFPFSRSPVVQSVLLLTETVSKNFSRESLTELLASPYMSKLLQGFSNPASAVETVSLNAGVEGGFHSWEKGIKKHIKREEDRLKSKDLPEYRKKEIEKNIIFSESVLKALVLLIEKLNRLSGEKIIAEHIKSLILFLKENAVPYIDDSCGDLIYKRDITEFLNLLNLLTSLSQTSGISGDEKISFNEFSRFFSSAVGNLRISEKRDDTKIQISGIQGLQDMEYDYVFLGGLVDGKVPDIPSLLPYTTEEEDRAIWPNKRREKVRWERFYFASALSSAKCALFLSCHSEAGGRQEIPSQFYETAVKALCAKPPEEEGQNVSFSFAVKETGRLLLKGKIYENFTLPPGVSPKNLCERINTEGFFRKGLYDSVYDGLLSSEDEIKEVLSLRFDEKHPYSPTSLETYAKCPFRFYLTHVLGLNPPQEKTFTLSAADRGELLHKTLFSFYKDWMKTHNNSPSENETLEALSLLKSHAKAEIESYEISGPAWDFMTKEILGDTGYGRGILEKFMEEETRLYRTGIVPKYFEAGFGFRGLETAFSDEAVRVESKNQKSIFLRGFVDRIDVKEGKDGKDDKSPDEFVIVDYKTGSHPKYNEIVAGKALQIPLYLKAVENAKNIKGIGGFYYKLSKREVYRKAELYEQSEEELFSNFPKAKTTDKTFSEIVENSVGYACRYAENIRNGIFTPAKETDDCSKYCEFKSVCRFSEFRLLEQENISQKENVSQNEATDTTENQNKPCERKGGF